MAGQADTASQPERLAGLRAEADVAGAVLISAFVSLSLTPVLNVLMASKKTGHGWFYRKTEPFFVALDTGYRDVLKTFMKRRWAAIPIVLACAGLIVLFLKIIPTELAPLEDRSLFRLTVTAPEGTSYDFMEKFADRLAGFVGDSVPENVANIEIVSPGFGGSGSVNIRAYPHDALRSVAAQTLPAADRGYDQ